MTILNFILMSRFFLSNGNYKYKSWSVHDCSGESSTYT